MEQIFSDAGLSSSLDDPGTEAWEADRVSTIQRSTDWRFVKEIARRYGYECFVRENEAFFRRPALDAEPAPVLAGQFGDRSTLNHVEFELDGLAPRSVALGGVDAFRKEAIDVRDQTAGLIALGGTAAGDLPEAASQGGGEHFALFRSHPPFPEPVLQAMGQGAVDKLSFVVQAAGEVDGPAYEHFLRPGSPVPIKGVGSRWSGNYYVRTVEHHFDPETYRASFEAVRNGVVSTGSEDFG